MNVEYLKYAVEIAKTKSINKAAENLYINQSNLSRAIKKLEEDTGITIFRRTSQGVELTLQGVTFLHHAQTILDEINSIENIKTPQVEKEKFSISVPKAVYISNAFVNFVNKVKNYPRFSIDYKESSTIGAVNNILEHDFNLGIVRYIDEYANLFKLYFSECGLVEKKLNEFTLYTTFSKNSPLANKQELTVDDFKDMIEITHGDSYMPYLHNNKLTEEFVEIGKKIRVYDSMGQLNMLNNIPNTFMIVFPLSYDVLEKYQLVQRKVEGFSKHGCDVLVHRKNYQISNLDYIFLNELELELKKESLK